MIVQGLTLLVAALLHEDVAILTASYFVLKHGMPVPFALTIVYAGVLANNGALYGFGAAARRVPGLRRWLIGDKVMQVRRRLKKHLMLTTLICRFLPGLLSPTFVACGWLRVPFARFMLATALTGALYVSAMTVLVLTFGETLLQWGAEVWLIALVALAVFVTAFVIRRRLSQKPVPVRG